MLQSVIGSTVSIALRNTLMLVGGLILLFITNAKLAGIIILGFPLVIIPILIYGRRVRQLSRLSQDRVAEVGSYVGRTSPRSRRCRRSTISLMTAGFSHRWRKMPSRLPV